MRLIITGQLIHTGHLTVVLLLYTT